MLVDRITKETTDYTRVDMDMSWWLDPGEYLTAVVSSEISLGTTGWSEAPYPPPGSPPPYDPTPLLFISVEITDNGTGLTTFVEYGTPGNVYTCTFILDGTSTRRVTIELGVQISGQPPVQSLPIPITPAQGDYALSIYGGTMLGPLYLFEDPLYPTEAATKAYVDQRVSTSGVTSFNSRSGAVHLTSNDITTALAYIPYNATNPAGFVTAAGAAAVAPVRSVAGRVGVITLTHFDITDWTNTIASALTPYALTTNIPVGSNAYPIMDGTATVGVASSWARADHIHPTDTSRYAANNPSGYQTAAQLSAAISAATYTLPTASTTVLGGVKVDGTTVTIASGVISSTVGATLPSNSVPLMDGTAGPGTGTTYSRPDHIHPTDTTRYAASNPSGYQTAAQQSAAIAAAKYTLPTASTTVLGGVKVDGTSVKITSGVISAPGAGGGITDAPSDSNIYGRMNATWVTVPVGSGGIADAPNDTTLYGRKSLGWAHLTHSDITDWATMLASYAPLASPVFSGTPSLPTGTIGITQVAGTANTSMATTAFVGAAISALPVSIADAPNDATLYGRKSLGWAHLIHTDITDWTTTLAAYAKLASPVFTGTPSLPTGTFGITQAPGTSGTSIATTAFVAAAVSAGTAGLVNSFNTRIGAVTLNNADVIAVLPGASTSPLVNGTATAGTGTTWARADHVHPVDLSMVVASDTPPAGARDNTFWFDSSGTGLYIKYNDGSSTQWVLTVGHAPAGYASRAVTLEDLVKLGLVSAEDAKAKLQ